MIRPPAATVRAGAAGLVVTSMLVFLFTPAARAADAPGVVIDSPGGVVSQPGVTVSGRATMHHVAGFETNRVTRVTLTLSSSVHPGPLPSCDPCNGGEGFSVPFSWSPPALAWNGPYRVTVVARGIEGPVDLNGEEQTTAVRDFGVAAPPATPKNVKTVVNPDRTVTVTWSANTEPDLIGYRVQRQDPGSDAWVDAGGLVTGSPAQHDPVPAGGEGGTYVYRVQAIRPGASGGQDTAVASAFASSDAPVPGRDGQPVPPDGPPGASAGDVGPGGVGAGSAPDLRGFLGGGGGGGPKSSDPRLPRLPGTPDEGFDTNLPYPDGQRRSKGAVEAITMGAAGLASNPRALAVPLAAGLVLFMASFHLRLLSRRMDDRSLVRQ